MPLRDYLQSRLGTLLYVNSFFYCFLLFTYFLQASIGGSFFSLLQSLLILVIILPLTGFNVAALLEFFFRQKFTFLEKFFLATLIALTIPPLFLSILFDAFGLYHSLLPFCLALSSFLLAFIFHSSFLDSSAKDPLPDNLTWTLGSSTILYTALVTGVVTSYYALPDFDPYYWLQLYQGQYTNQILTPLTGYRTLFSSLSFFFYSTASVDFFAYFKYILPFFILLTLLPLALIAKRCNNSVLQLLIFGTPFITSSFLLYTLTPIPQSLLNIGAILFGIALLHSYFTRNNFFFTIAGIFILILSLYHEVAMVFFMFWFIISLFYFKEFIKKSYQASPFLLTATSFLLFVQFFKIFQTATDFLFSWLQKLFVLLLQSTPNFRYPATYINIDGNAVGWDSSLGVIQYYIFYSGGIFALLTLIALVYFFQKKILFTKTKEFLILFASLLFFFFLAEILPRFFNIAILPERAWGFVALFSYFIFIIFLIKNVSFYQFRYHKIVLFIFLVVFGIHIGGALYINNLKQYLITQSQLKSAEWIKHQLPQDRVIFTQGNESLLRTHSQSAILNSSDPDFYQDIRIFNNLLKKYRINSLDLKSQYAQYTKRLDTANRQLVGYDLNSEKDAIVIDTLILKKATEDFLEYIEKENDDDEKLNQPMYIYFAKPSSLNPYSKRPYYSPSSEIQSSGFVFDKDSHHFQRVYSLPNDEVVIWQYLP